jgi:hypothetical protein
MAPPPKMLPGASSQRRRRLRQNARAHALPREISQDLVEIFFDDHEDPSMLLSR